MNKREAAGIIDSMIEPIKTDPQQFQIKINVTGQSVSNVSGGTGLAISAIGGGPGSNTIGQKVTLNGAQIEIARKAASDAMNQEMETLINSLSTISKELKSQKLDKERILKVYESIKKKTWVPSLITSVLGSIFVQGTAAMLL